MKWPDVVERIAAYAATVAVVWLLVTNCHP